MDYAMRGTDVATALPQATPLTSPRLSERGAPASVRHRALYTSASESHLVGRLGIRGVNGRHRSPQRHVPGDGEATKLHECWRPPGAANNIIQPPPLRALIIRPRG